MIPDFQKTVNDKLHVNITAVNSNKHADMYELMRPLDKQEIAHMQSSVEHIYDRFLNIVAEGRSMSINDVDAIAQGRIWTGAQALEIGLVDQIGSIDDAVVHAAMLIDKENGMNDIMVAEYPKPVTTMDMLTSILTGEEIMEIAEPLKSIYSAFHSWNESQSGKFYARIPYAIEIK